jgi:hypothetical protein
METECTPTQLEFQGLGRRDVVAKFDGGQISSDGGGLLLREVERKTGIIRRLAECFRDFRDPDAIEHTVEDLLGQRIYGLALGYEDINDHDRLRLDHLLAVLVNKEDPTGGDRAMARDKGKPLASSSTLNRLELTHWSADHSSRYKKIVAQVGKIDNLLVDLYLDAHDEAPRQIWLDLDATDDPLHGSQEGRFFHGYYKNYCYLPLYIFAGEHLLCARLREANQDASAGSVEELERIVAQIRQRWPATRIIIRADSGFCREEIMAWCEANGVDFLLGLAKNKRLNALMRDEMAQAKEQAEATQAAARVFKDFSYRTCTSWSRARRVVGKAEHLRGGANPRYVVTSLSQDTYEARSLYEDHYCARGDMENRIKEQQLDLFADRTSSHGMRANQNRLYFSSFAYVLLCALRRIGLQGTELAKAQCGTVRTRLLKIGAQVRISVRKVWVSLAECYPYAELFAQVLHNLQTRPPTYAPG